LVNIGTLSSKDAIEFGITGPVIRSCGFKKDLRLSKSETYSNY
jgi:NADH:ubiquinone oxidoreductase subunit D